MTETNCLWQIFPTTYRARGLNFAASGGSIGSIIVAQVWPIGVAKFGSRVYFFFFAVNAICVPVCDLAAAAQLLFSVMLTLYA